MTFTDNQKKLLDAPLDRANVKARTQSGRSLSYIESWLAISEANRIFGFDAWSSETVEIKCVAERERKIGTQQKDGWSVSYTAKVRVTVAGVVREGVGAGHGIDADLGLAHESAIKEAESDARKRGLMTFGNPFGLALYDKTQANVADEPKPAPQPAAPVTPANVGSLTTKIAVTKTTGELQSLWTVIQSYGEDELPQSDFDNLAEMVNQRLAELQGRKAAPKSLGDHLDNLHAQEAAH